MESLHPENRTDASAETQPVKIPAGYDGGKIGNPDGYIKDREAEYSYTGPLEQGKLYLRGKFKATAEFIETTEPGENSIMLEYSAVAVNALLGPGEQAIGTVEVVVRNDDAPLSIRNATPDTTFRASDTSGDETVVLVDRKRVYQLVDNHRFGTHILELVCHTPGLRVYAFTFVSSAKPETAERQKPAA